MFYYTCIWYGQIGHNYPNIEAQFSIGIHIQQLEPISKSFFHKWESLSHLIKKIISIKQ